jgi:hypothetical protein
MPPRNCPTCPDDQQGLTWLAERATIQVSITLDERQELGWYATQELPYLPG